MSVVIPTHNGSSTIERSIVSALNQDGLAEVIVVDDGSDGEERASVESIVAAHPGVKAMYLPEASGRPAHPRNEGVRHLATCDLVLFLDDDDELLPGALPALVEASSDGVALVAGDCRVEEEEGAYLSSAHFGVPEGPEALLEKNYWPLHAICFRREWFDRLGGFDTRLAALEDWHLILRVLLSGGTFRTVEQLVAVYYPRAAGVSRWQSPDQPLVQGFARVDMFKHLYAEFGRPELQACSDDARRRLGLQRLGLVANGMYGRQQWFPSLVRGAREAGWTKDGRYALVRALLGAERFERARQRV